VTIWSIHDGDRASARSSYVVGMHLDRRACNCQRDGAATSRCTEVSRLPEEQVWNKRVDKLPKKKNSDAIIESIGLDEGLHWDFGVRKVE
jgi:hypothetical protein